ncbi:MAG: hypothetical protein P8Q97_15925 [Myxococcota bacterium]|nr:hypothetical protein [Myxococcota bacterium]
MRRRHRKDTEVTLFPFLSVLACVIGTLILLLSAVAVGGIGERSLESVRLSERFEAAEMYLAGGRAILKEYEAQLRLAEIQAKENEELGQELAGLGLSPDISLDDLEARVNALEELESLAERSGKLTRQARDLEARAEKRDGELEERESERLESPILITPSGKGPDYKPFLVECTAEYLELHRTKGDFSFRIPASEIRRSPEFKKFLRRVRAISRGMVIFLIRPDGVANYIEAEEVAEQFNVRNAKLPLPGTGGLDFSQLQEAGG